MQVYVSERCRGGHYRPATAKGVERVLLRFARDVGPDLAPDQLRRMDVDNWLGRRGVTVSTIRHQHSVLRAFLTWLVVSERMQRNPMEGMKPPKEPRRLPRGMQHANVARLLGTLDARGQLVVSLMVQEGLRCGEVARLEVGDIDLVNNAMLVNGKGGHQRALPISEETLGFLRRYLAEDPVSSGPIIRSSKSSVYPGRPITATYLSALVSEWMTAAGIKGKPWDGVSGHALRHTCATDMLREGAHVRDVQAVLGHAMLATTERYLPWVVNDLKSAMSGRSYRLR